MIPGHVLCWFGDMDIDFISLVRRDFWLILGLFYDVLDLAFFAIVWLCIYYILGFVHEDLVVVLVVLVVIIYVEMNFSVTTMHRIGKAMGSGITGYVRERLFNKLRCIRFGSFELMLFLYWVPSFS